MPCVCCLGGRVNLRIVLQMRCGFVSLFKSFAIKLYILMSRIFHMVICDSDFITQLMKRNNNNKLSLFMLELKFEIIGYIYTYASCFVFFQALSWDYLILHIIAQ